MKKIIVTVDGPAASGKEKIAKYISKKWDLKHLDSGILYRRLAYIFLSEDINIKNITEIRKKIKQIKKISYQKSKKIRTQEIGKIASKIAVNSATLFECSVKFNLLPILFILTIFLSGK